MSKQAEIQSPFPAIGKVEVLNTSEQSHHLIVHLPNDDRLYELLSISGKSLGIVVKSETWAQPQNLFLKVLEGIFKRESVLDGDAAVISVCVREWSDDSDMDDECGTDMVLAVNSQIVMWLSSAALGTTPTPSEETEKATCRPSVDEMIRKKKENQERRLSTSTSEVEIGTGYEGREQSEMRDRSEPPSQGPCEDDGLAFAERQELQNEKEEYMANRTKIDGMAALFQGIADFTESVGLTTEDLVECFERAGGSGKAPSLAAVSGDEVAHKFLQSREGGCSQQ